MFEIISVLFLLYTLTKIYISVMEIDFIKKAKLAQPVILSSTNYHKAADYKVASERFSILSSLYEYALFNFWIILGFSVLNNLHLYEDMNINYLLLTLVFILVNYVLELPFSLYKTFSLDTRFGFTTIDAKTYLLDTVKSAFILALVGAPVIYGIILIIQSFALWWVYGFSFIFAIIILINAIYPTLIAPIFNKFKTLEDESLNVAITSLLDSVGFKSSGVFTIDASKRDNRLNAYFGGLGKTKRVVLFDTLVEKLTQNELLAVLGHELGHFKHNDILKNIALTAVMLFSLFGIFGNLPDSFYNHIGLTPTPFAVIAVFMLISGAISFFFLPFINYISRKNEYAADAFGSECVNEAELANALMKLANENKSFPMSHPISSLFYHSHPQLTERLAKLGVDIHNTQDFAKGEDVL